VRRRASKSEDISKKTVLVVLLIAIIVSIVGTWTVLDTLSSIRFVMHGQGNFTDGELIGPIHREPKTATAGAMVYLKVDQMKNTENIPDNRSSQK